MTDTQTDGQLWAYRLNRQLVCQFSSVNHASYDIISYRVDGQTDSNIYRNSQHFATRKEILPYRLHIST